LNLSNFNTTNTTYMSWMFYGCGALTKLDLSNFNTTNTTYMSFMFDHCSRLRELRLGPNTHLAATATDTSAGLSPDSGWVELTAPGGPTPVPSLVARTARDSGRSPEGHYVRATLTVTVDYNNGQPDHAKTLNPATSAAGTQRIDWGTQPAPAGKVFDGWAFTTSDPEHVTLDGNTVTWTDLGTDVTTGASTATITAKWRDPGTPAIAVNIHADGAPNPDGTPGPWAEITATLPKGAAAGDGIRLESANGTGRTADCTPAAGTGTCTFNLTIAQLRDASDYDAPYRLKASVSAKDTRTDPAGTAYGTPADKQGILPYTTVNYQSGTGTGTPPATAKALTDTDSRTAQLTVAGPSPIKRPEHNLFATWHSGNGTDVHAGTTPVPTSLGDTDTQGRTTIDLTAQWTPLAAPAGVNATRDPADNSVTISGTATPHSNTDTIRICHTAPGGGTQCHDTTTDTTDQHGNTLPYNGTTEHPWHITLPASTPDGDWSVDTTLTTKDTAYPTGNQQVDSPTTHTNIHIPTPYTGTLPLTGGNNRPALLTLATALAAVTILTATATRLRNHRRKTHHANNNR
ncbi:surface protein, partial [Bifidobacterium commune]